MYSQAYVSALTVGGILQPDSHLEPQRVSVALCDREH